MRILQIHPFMKSESLAPAVGGMPRAALQLTRLLVEAGHDVRVLPIPEGVGSRALWEVTLGRSVEVLPAMDIPARNDLRWLFGAVFRLQPKSRSFREVYYDACALTALRRALLSFRPDVVHNHLARRPFPRLMRALDRRERLLLTHHHGEQGEDLDVYDRLVFPSRSALERITEESRYPKDRARCIYNAVSPAVLHSRLNPDTRREGICYVGAVRRRKGIDLLLEAYRLDSRLWKEPLILCGAGEDAALVEQAAREGLPVRWLGHLSQEAIVRQLLHAKLVAIPSRLEGFSIALVEALCSGTPVVGWAPQVRELEALLGMAVGEPFDGRTQTVQELAATLRCALTGKTVSAGHRRRLAKAARDFFSEERFLAAYLEMYREMGAA